jgi:hypothetical protein
MSKGKPFSDDLHWFYTHCATNHVALNTKKGMIDSNMGDAAGQTTFLHQGGDAQHEG